MLFINIFFILLLEIKLILYIKLDITRSRKNIDKIYIYLYK